MPKGGKVIGALRPLFEGQGSIAGNDSDLEYGVSRGANGKHYVRFNARVQTGENAYLAGGAFGDEPTNSKQNLTVKNINPKLGQKNQMEIPRLLINNISCL